MDRERKVSDCSAPRTRKGASTCARLLHAAEQVFSERGYHDTSVTEICRQAGLAHGTFYRYFVGKEEIFLRLLEQLEERFRARIKPALASSGLARERLLLACQSILHCIAECTQLYQVFREVEFVQLEVYRRFHTDIASLLCDILRIGVQEGEFRSLDPEIVAYSLLGITEFIAMRYIIWEPGGLTAEIRRSIDEIVLHGIDTGKEISSRSEPHLPRKNGTEGMQSVDLTGGEATRYALLTAAERLFGQEGFYKTTISVITYVAGVSQGTFYLYFPSKVAIFTELVNEVNHRLRATARASICDLNDRREIEQEGFRNFFRFIRHHREAYRILREAEFVDQESGRWYYQRLAQGYVPGLCRGMEQGEIRRFDPEPLAYALLGVGHFIGLRWLFLGEREQISESTLATMLDFILHGILLPE